MPIKRGRNWFTNLRYSYQGEKGRIRQKVGPRRKDAVEAEARIRAAMATNTYVLPEDQRLEQDQKQQSRLLFADFVCQEFVPWSEVNHSPGHHKRQQGIVKKHLIPQFQQLYLDDITLKHIDGYLMGRMKQRKKPVTAATVNRELMCLKSIFRKAVEYGHISTSPATEISAFKELENPPRLLEQREVAAILREMPDRMRLIMALAAYAGLRQEEVFNLKWDDLNLKTRELYVLGKGRKRRRIPISEELLEHIRRHPRRLGSRLVCPNQQGTPYSDIRGTLNTAVARAGIEDHVTMHQFRHAFCSHMQMEGVAASTVQKWMGHKSLTTTLRYSHVSPEYEKEAIQRLKYRERNENAAQAGGGGVQ